MDQDLLLTLVSVFGGGCLAFLLAWMTGMLVPASKLTAAIELGRQTALTAEKLQLANATLQKSVDNYEAEMRRSAETQQLANALLTGIKDYIKKPGD